MRSDQLDNRISFTRVGDWPGPSTATGWLAAVNAAVETCCCCRPASETEICPDRIRRRPSFPERSRFSCIEFRRRFERNRRTFAAEIAVDCRPWCPIRWSASTDGGWNPLDTSKIFVQLFGSKKTKFKSKVTEFAGVGNDGHQWIGTATIWALTSFQLVMGRQSGHRQGQQHHVNWNNHSKHLQSSISYTDWQKLKTNLQLNG